MSGKTLMGARMDCAGSVCGGARRARCLARDGARALMDDGACATCARPALMEFLRNGTREDAHRAMRADPHVTLSAPRGDDAAASAILAGRGFVGLYRAW